MKRINNRYFLIIISFFVGIFFTLLIVVPISVKIINRGNIYERSSLARSINKIDKSVVTIRVEDRDSSGSGFIYKTDSNYAYVLTNDHVCSDKDNIKVVFYNDKEEDAKLLGSDKYLDIAVLRINKRYVSMVAKMGSSNKMKVGDVVFSIGTPVDYEYHGSVTSGIISGKDRAVKTTLSNTDKRTVMNLLQFDAPINSGNSGGPLVNANGDVVGICTLKITDSNVEGMGFAVPIDDIKGYIKTLENGKGIKWPSLGIDVAKDSLGAMVTYTDNDGAAYIGGIRKGDIITKIGNNDIDDPLYLDYYLYKYRVGNTIEISYIDGSGIKRSCKVILK